jgi:hypothetical protein
MILSFVEASSTFWFSTKYTKQEQNESADFILATSFQILYACFGWRNDRFMNSLWKIVERDSKLGKWAVPYVSLSPDGVIWLTRVTWEKTGSPAAYLIMIDDTNQRIGLKATGAGIKHAYKAYKTGNAGSKKLRCRRMLIEHANASVSKKHPFTLFFRFKIMEMHLR